MLLPLIVWDLQDYNVQTLKFFVFGSRLKLKFFIQKFTKIKCYLGIFTTFGSDFQTKTTIHGSHLIHRFKCMMRYNCLSGKGYWTETWTLWNFKKIRKNKRTLNHNLNGRIEDYIMWNHIEKKKRKLKP
jgi:hypothetical protein